MHDMYTCSHTSLESLNRVLTSFLSINSARGINKDPLYPLMFIMHDIAYFGMQINSGTHGYVKYNSENKVYVNLHVETRGYVSFHSEIKEDVIFTLRSKRT